MYLKSECTGANDDDFVQAEGTMKELTVTITLCEYRNLITERTRYEAEVDRLQDRLKQAEEREKLMTDVVMLDHPEFYTDMFDAVVKFLKKANTPVSVEEVNENG